MEVQGIPTSKAESAAAAAAVADGISPLPIDVDLIQGSAFKRSVPTHRTAKVLRRLYRRVVFFPFYRKFWLSQISTPVFLGLSGLYLFHQATLVFLTIDTAVAYLCKNDPYSETYCTADGLSMPKTSFTEALQPSVALLFGGWLYSWLNAYRFPELLRVEDPEEEDDDDSGSSDSDDDEQIDTAGEETDDDGSRRRKGGAPVISTATSKRSGGKHVQWSTNPTKEKNRPGRGSRENSDDDDEDDGERSDTTPPATSEGERGVSDTSVSYYNGHSGLHQRPLRRSSSWDANAGGPPGRVVDDSEAEGEADSQRHDRMIREMKQWEDKWHERRETLKGVSAGKPYEKKADRKPKTASGSSGSPTPSTNTRSSDDVLKQEEGTEASDKETHDSPIPSSRYDSPRRPDFEGQTNVSPVPSSGTTPTTASLPPKVPVPLSLSRLGLTMTSPQHRGLRRSTSPCTDGGTIPRNRRSARSMDHDTMSTISGKRRFLRARRVLTSSNLSALRIRSPLHRRRLDGLAKDTSEMALSPSAPAAAAPTSASDLLHGASKALATGQLTTASNALALAAADIPIPDAATALVRPSPIPEESPRSMENLGSPHIAPVSLGPSVVGITHFTSSSTKPGHPSSGPTSTVSTVSASNPAVSGEPRGSSPGNAPQRAMSPAAVSPADGYLAEADITPMHAFHRRAGLGSTNLPTARPKSRRAINTLQENTGEADVDDTSLSFTSSNKSIASRGESDTSHADSHAGGRAEAQPLDSMPPDTLLLARPAARRKFDVGKRSPHGSLNDYSKPNGSKGDKKGSKHKRSKHSGQGNSRGPSRNSRPQSRAGGVERAPRRTSDRPLSPPMRLPPPPKIPSRSPVMPSDEEEEYDGGAEAQPMRRPAAASIRQTPTPDKREGLSAFRTAEIGKREAPHSGRDTNATPTKRKEPVVFPPDRIGKKPIPRLSQLTRESAIQRTASTASLSSVEVGLTIGIDGDMDLDLRPRKRVRDVISSPKPTRPASKRMNRGLRNQGPQHFRVRQIQEKRGKSLLSTPRIATPYSTTSVSSKPTEISWGTDGEDDSSLPSTRAYDLQLHLTPPDTSKAFRSPPVPATEATEHSQGESENRGRNKMTKDRNASPDVFQAPGHDSTAPLSTRSLPAPKKTKPSNLVASASAPHGSDDAWTVQGSGVREDSFFVKAAVYKSGTVKKKTITLRDLSQVLSQKVTASVSKGQAARSRLPWILGIFLATFPLFYRGIIQYPHAVIRSFDRLSNTTDIVHAQLATPSTTLSWSTWSKAPSPAPTCALPYLLHPSLPLGPTCMEGRCSLWDSLPCVWSSGVVAVEIEEPAAAVNATAEDAGGPRPLQHTFASLATLLFLEMTAAFIAFIPTFQSAVGATFVQSFPVMVCCGASVASAVFLLRSLSRAERTFRKRYLAAKYFDALTSTRRSRRLGLPHFRLHKMSHIKMWLSLRSLMQRRGLTKSVDTVVSLSFIGAMMLVIATMGLQITRPEDEDSTSELSILYWTVLSWCLSISVYLLKFMTLGSAINQRYRGSSVLLTEQINLYLRMLKSPHKKTELVIANNILKLATKLIKEVEVQRKAKVSGLSMSPLLFHITRVVLLSALSAVISDVLGFKLKLWKLKV